MSYERYYPNGWQSGETGGTPITPEALNHIEEGLAAIFGKALRFKRTLTADDDMDNSKDDGIYVYSTASVPANAPFANAAVILGFGSDSDSSQKIQFGIRYGDAGHFKFRSLYSNKWNDWAEVAQATNGVVAVANGGTGASTAAAARANLGAAPSGCGYGESLPTINASTEAEFESSLLTIASTMENHSTKQVKAMLSFLSFTTYSVVEIYKHSGGNHLLATIRSTQNVGTTLQKRYTSSNGWKPIEWYNPPMDAGVEYRTIERCGGDSVYRKRIVLEHTADVGSSDGLSLGVESVVHGLALKRTVELNAFAYCADGEIVPIQFEKITDSEFRISTSHGVWKKPTYEINIAFTKP